MGIIFSSCKEVASVFSSTLKEKRTSKTFLHLSTDSSVCVEEVRAELAVVEWCAHLYRKLFLAIAAIPYTLRSTGSAISTVTLLAASALIVLLYYSGALKLCFPLGWASINGGTGPSSQSVTEEFNFSSLTNYFSIDG